MDSPTDIQSVREVLQAFQDGYTHRDPAKLDEFMQLFVPGDELEVIGTGASTVEQDEWCLGQEMMRKLVDGDWRYWGDVRVDIAAAHIHCLGDAAWLATPGTVSMKIGKENYQEFLDYLQKSILERKDWSAEEKVLYIARGATGTVYELFRGEQFIWPFRFTAVLVRREGKWLFHQMQFSFPTTNFPDVRKK